MGMFDTWEILTDHFREGEPFTLEAAKVGPSITTDFGQQEPSLLRINGKWYSIFGAAILAQVRRADSDDFPMEVRICRVPSNKGNDMKVLVPVGMEPEQFVSAQRKSREASAQQTMATGTKEQNDDIPF